MKNTIILKRNKMRVYKDKYLSVTSIIDLKDPFDDKSFKIWCEKNGKNQELISNTSRLLGTRVSEALENKFLGLEHLTPPAVDECDRGLYRAVESYLGEWVILDAEREVFCDEFHYAGRLDLIAQNKETGNKVLFDAKTFGAWKRKPYKRDSKKVKHAKWQTTLYGYAIGWEDKLGVAVFNGDGTFHVEYLTPDKEIIEWVSSNQELILKVIADYNEKTQQEDPPKQARQSVEQSNPK